MEMTQAEYARHRGVSRKTVTKWVQAQRIALLPNGKINPADADFALGASQERAVAREAAPPLAPAGRAFSPPVETGLNKARTAEALYDARIKQLKFEQMRGNLVPTAEVVDAAIACSETMLRAFDRLPSYAEFLVGKDLQGARSGLKQIERDLRAVVSAAFGELAASAKRAAMAQAQDDETEVDS